MEEKGAMACLHDTPEWRSALASRSLELNSRQLSASSAFAVEGSCTMISSYTAPAPGWAFVMIACRSVSQSGYKRKFSSRGMCIVSPLIQSCMNYLFFFLIVSRFYEGLIHLNGLILLATNQIDPILNTR